MATKRNNPAEKLSSNNLIIVLILVTLLVLGITGLAAKSLVTDIIRDGKVFAAKQQAEKNLDTDIENSKGLVESYKSLGPQLTTILANALPSKVDFPSLMVTLEQMSGDSALAITAIEQDVKSTGTAESGTSGTAAGADSSAPPAQPGATAAPKTFPFHITFAGRYDTLRKFLGDIEISARPMRVTYVKLTGTGSVLAGDIGLETYYQDAAEMPFSTRTIK